MAPHGRVHRRRHEKRLGTVVSQEERAGKVVGEARGEAVERVGRRGADDHRVGPAAELDVLKGRAGFEEIREDALAC